MMTMVPFSRAAALLGGALLLAACPPRSNSSSKSEEVPACDSTSGVLPAGATLAKRSGRYDLVLLASSGTKAGSATRSTLLLEETMRSAAGTVSYSLQGTSDVSVDMVGGTLPGSAASRDRGRPGVLVMEYSRDGASSPRRNITLRFGHEANGAQLADQPFDGAYMALHVRTISADGFAGRWESGVDGRTAAGHFCARRTGDS